MNIGIVCYPTYGGSGIVATELGMELAKLGHSVHFISSSKPARLNITLPNIYFHQVQIKNYPLFEYVPYGIALSSMIVEISRVYSLDILHVHYAIPHAYHAYIAKQILKEEGINLPVITTLHGTDITLVGKHPTYKCGVEFSINQSDYVTSVSESLKKDTLSTFKIKKEIIAIPNFIDLDLYKKDEICIRSCFANNNEKIIVHVSNLRPVKRIIDVMEIFNLVQKDVKSKLIIIGEGPEIENIEILIQKYSLYDKIKLLGKVDNLYKILRVCDVFLLPSELESFGLAALEAMASGLPVVSSNAGGLPEVNKNNFSGFVEEIGDVKSMSEKIKYLFTNDDVLNQFKINARKRAEKFDKKMIMPKYIELYNNAIKK